MIEIIGVINRINQDAIKIFILSNGRIRYIVCPRKHMKRLTIGFLKKVLYWNPNEQQGSQTREKMIKLIKRKGDIIYSYEI